VNSARVLCLGQGTRGTHGENGGKQAVKWRSTVVLLVVACGLGLYLYFFQRTQPAKTERGEEKRRLFQLSADDIDHLHITHGEVAVTLERESAPKGKEPQWRMTGPITARASGLVLDQMARDLASLDWESRLAGEAQDSQKVKEQGLAEPRATLAFRHQGKVETLEFGDDTPLGDRVYLRRPGGADLYEVRKSFLTSLLKGVDEFRDTTVLPFTLADVKKFSISRQGEHLVAESNERRWQLLAPFPAGTRADRDRIEEVLKKLNGLRIEQFVADAREGQGEGGGVSPGTVTEEALKTYGLATPVLVAELEAGGKSESISFGGRVPDHPDWRYARTADGTSVYAVKADVAESMARPFLEFRDRRLTRLTADRVQMLTVALAPAQEGGDRQTVEVVRKEPTSATPPEAEAPWRVTKPRAIDADEDAVRELLRDIDTRTALDFVDVPAGAAAPTAASAAPPATSADPAPAAATPAPAPATLTPAAPSGPPPTDQPAGPDRPQTSEKLETPASDLAPYGLDKPRATLTLATGTGEKEVIQVGSATAEGGRLYLRRDEEPTVLLVDEEFGRLALRGYLAYRTKKLTDVKREDVTHIRIERPGAGPQGGRPASGTVELSKEKNDWQLVTPIKKRGERAAVDDLLFELTPLHADSIVAEEVADFTPYGLDSPTYRLEVQVTKEGEKPQSTVVNLGAATPQGGRFARLGSEGLVATLPLTFVDSLDAEFRQRTVSTFDRDKVEELTLKGVTPEVVAVRVAGAWQLRQPEGQSLDGAKVTSLVDELKSLRVQRWVTYEATDLSPYGLDNPVAVVSVRLGGLEPETRTVAFGAEAQGGDVFARVEGDPGVFLLPKRLLEKVQGSLLVQPLTAPTSAEPTPEGTPAPAPASGQAPATGPAQQQPDHPESERPPSRKAGAPRAPGAPAPPSPPEQAAPAPGG
jgi:hypothetical protein